MPPPDHSPVHRVVLAARALGPITPNLRGRYSYPKWRATTWRAGADEFAIKVAARIDYNPSADVRIKWLLQWCEVLEGSCRAIDEHLTATMEFLCQIPPPISGKQRAYGETLTLAQGS
ncbi:MAG: hypothetical protein JHC76_11140 [Akkermansiaceae bacterium]|nr:hypothetical protein [Akkermansiaceae bacterium]